MTLEKRTGLRDTLIEYSRMTIPELQAVLDAGIPSGRRRNVAMRTLARKRRAYTRAAVEKIKDVIQARTGWPDVAVDMDENEIRIYNPAAEQEEQEAGEG